MSQYALRVQNLSKQYQIGRRPEQVSVREAFVGAARAPLNWIRRGASDASRRVETIWALQDVSLDVEHGEVLGLIGRNGAGKSTLLKILSQITEPTRGRAELYGRVGSLLEVGTGFHDELTGRENIFLSGAMLGMHRSEISRKFDEIVAFSGVEKFIDTPIKRYSSGMKVRLGFAVAAHLEPEILLVDEVLAVGDAAFQKKCLGKMSEVAGEGRTVLFVSHNMAAVQNLTHRAVCLDAGRIAYRGETGDVISSYLRQFETGEMGARVDLQQHPAATANQLLRTLELDSPLSAQGAVLMGDEVVFRIHYWADSPVGNVHVGIVIETESGVPVVSFGTYHAGFDLPTLHGAGELVCHAGHLPLNQGTYFARPILAQLHGPELESYDRALRFRVLPTGHLSATVLDSKWGFLAWPADWRLHATPEKRTQVEEA